MSRCISSSVSGRSLDAIVGCTDTIFVSMETLKNQAGWGFVSLIHSSIGILSNITLNFSWQIIIKALWLIVLWTTLGHINSMWAAGPPCCAFSCRFEQFLEWTRPSGTMSPHTARTADPYFCDHHVYLRGMYRMLQLWEQAWELLSSGHTLSSLVNSALLKPFL